MNSSSQQRMDLLLSLINANLSNSFDGRPSARNHCFPFSGFHSFFLVLALACFLSHLLPFSCPFCFPNTCVRRQPSLCQGTHGEVIGMGSLWASNHEINMDGHE